jgi:hypothetical protein
MRCYTRPATAPLSPTGETEDPITCQIDPTEPLPCGSPQTEVDLPSVPGLNTHLVPRRPRSLRRSDGKRQVGADLSGWAPGRSAAARGRPGSAASSGRTPESGSWAISALVTKPKAVSGITRAFRDYRRVVDARAVPALRRRVAGRPEGGDSRWCGRGRNRPWRWLPPGRARARVPPRESVGRCPAEKQRRPNC